MEVQTSQYWISPTALYISLNALGNADYIQANVVSGASILCYIPGVTGLGYDDAHNYKRWQLIVAPTFFEESSEKYVYVAIPKDSSVTLAPIVFPSEHIDLYGQNDAGEQIGNTNYYFLWIRGIITASVGADGKTQLRDWQQRIDCGTLSTDEALNAGGDNPWWKYSAVDDSVTFLKNIADATFLSAKINRLVLGGSDTPLTGVANYPATSSTSDHDVVTPKYLQEAISGKYLSRLNPDTAQGQISFLDGVQFGESFASGLAGMGGRIDGRGVGELEALTLRRWLEVPELRYNRVEVMVGNQWRAPGGGVIERVVPDVDENGEELASGTVWLKLEEGEIGKIAVDDICMGVWHEGTNVEDNEIADADDGRGNFKFAGFMTAYWRIEEVESADGGTNNVFRYVLRGRTEAFPQPKHPRAMMHFVCYGNFTDEERRQSRYSTLRYERYLKGVKDWEFGVENVGAQFGDLSNLSLWGLDMTGYSAYLANIYMTGTIQQLEAVPLRMEIENDMDGFLDWGESCTLTCRVMKGWEDRTAAVTDWTIMRETGDEASDTAWGLKEKAQNFKGVIRLTLGEEENDMGTGQSALFRMVARMGDGKTTVGEVRI